MSTDADSVLAFDFVAGFNVVVFFFALTAVLFDLLGGPDLPVGFARRAGFDFAFATACFMSGPTPLDTQR
jgi:hypothetical protein